MAVTALVSGATSTLTSPAIGCAGELDLRCHVFSAAGSTASVQLQCSLDGTNYFVVATVTNPSATGELWSIPRCEFFRVNINTYASGSITALFDGLRGGTG